MTLQIGDLAPDFEADTTEGRIRFHNWIGNSWVVLLSHPKDFTAVCATELSYMACIKPEFDKRNTKIIGLSVNYATRGCPSCPTEHRVKRRGTVEHLENIKEQQRFGSSVMSINKGLLAASFLLPLVLASAIANAGETISEKRYWPSEATRTTPARTAVSQRDLNSAFAFDQGGLRSQPAIASSPVGTAWRYQGGPKSH